MATRRRVSSGRCGAAAPPRRLLVPLSLLLLLLLPLLQLLGCPELAFGGPGDGSDGDGGGGGSSEQPPPLVLYGETAGDAHSRVGAAAAQAWRGPPGRRVSLAA
eukprot:155179-Chlamydomonas_euryale.AAC.1